MADVVGQLVIQMQADVARLRKDMQDATGSVQSASRDMERNAKSVKDSLGAIGAGFSVVAIVAGLKALATSMLEAQNQTDKFRSAMASVAGEANVARDLEFDMAKVNPNGSGISLGHPVGATGTIVTVKAMYEMRRTGGKHALVTMCIGGGQGIAAVLERV